MKTRCQEVNYRNEIKDILENKYYVIGLILVAIAAYGFSITHFAMGIDDFGVIHYMDISSESVGNMLQQGRLLHLLFYYILRVADVIPFFNNFIATVLLVISAILLSALIQSVTCSRFNIIQLFLFSSIYVSYSILSFKFIYDIDVIVTMFSYVVVILGIVFCLKSMRCKGNEYLKNFLLSIFCLIGAIGSYEVFITVYICEVLFLLIIQYLYLEKPVGTVIIEGLKFARNLVLAVSIYYGVVKILQVVTRNPAYKRQNFLTGDFTLKTSLEYLYERLVENNFLFTKEFVAFAMLSMLIMLYYTFIKRKIFSLILFLSLDLFVVFVQIMQGYVYYRTCLTFNVFIACISLLITEVMKKKYIFYNIVVGILGLLLIWQLRDINAWFYKDWINYQKNVWAIHSIATELQENYDVKNKAVCFVNRDYDSFLMTVDEKQQEIGESPLIASVAFLGEPTSRSTIEMFRYQGYNFIKEPTVEQMEKAKEFSKNMNSYPVEGYIEELSDCIVVNIGKYTE